MPAGPGPAAASSIRRGGPTPVPGPRMSRPPHRCAQTLWEITPTLQFKPVPSLITRVEFRYDKSDKNVFLHGQRPVNNQETSVIPSGLRVLRMKLFPGGRGR